MADKTNQKECAHPNCSCPAQAGQEYCSPKCAAAADDEMSCDCGHSGCGTAHANA